jgi:GNAT superfamily N-acetyltransferase
MLAEAIDTRITFGVETYQKFYEDVRQLLPQHHRELGPYQDAMPLVPDYSFYEKAFDAGMARFYTARDMTALIGYAIYFVKPNPHYSTTGWAVSDIIWVHPEHRRAGVGHGLFDLIESDMRKNGIMVLHTTAKQAHNPLQRLLLSRGHKLVELGFQIRLK